MAAPPRPVRTYPAPVTDCIAVVTGGLESELWRLHGDEQADEIVWLEGLSTGRRYVVTWPHGYSARFSPMLELLNELGQPIARGGDVLEIHGPADRDNVGVCSIVAVNGRLLAAPVVPATPTLTPRATNGQQGSPAASDTPAASATPTPRAPPPVGFGHVELTICGDDGLNNEEEGGDPIEFFVVTFHALDGQPGTVVPVAGGSCEQRSYRVWAGSYEIEVTAPGWQSGRLDGVTVLVGEVPSMIATFVVIPEVASPSPR